MRILKKMRKQTAVYWAPTGNDRYGQHTFGPAQELAPPNGVRWEDMSEEFIDATGRTAISKSNVYTGIDVQVGGFFFNGPLSAVVDQVNPANNPGCFEILQFQKIPTLKANDNLRIAIL